MRCARALCYQQCMWSVLTVALLLAAPSARPPSVSDALALEKKGDDVAALALLDRLIQSQPTWELPRLEAGRLRIKLGQDVERAQLDLDVARSLAPENPRAHYLYGVVREEQRADEDALRAYRIAVSLRPSFDDAQFRIAGIHFARGEWAEAEAAYAALGKRRPDWMQVHLQRVTALERLERWADAEQALVQLRSREPRSPVVARRLADLYERTGRPELAQKLRAELAPKNERKLRPLKKSRR